MNAVNIALIDRGAPVFGVIASPVEEKLLFGGKSLGVFICSFEDIIDSTKWTSTVTKIGTCIGVGNTISIIETRSRVTWRSVF